MKNKLRAFFFGGPGSATALGDVGLLVLRIGMGFFMAFGHGLGKLWQNGHFGMLPGMTDGVADMGFPAPVVFAWLSALTEFLGAILLMVGLLTRPAAVALTFNMFVAAFIALKSAPMFITGPDPAKETALLFLIPFLTLVLTGAGRFSVDRYLR